MINPLYSEESKRKQMALVDHCCSEYYVTVGAIFNLAQSAMVDALSYIRKDKRYRQRTKKEINLALAAYDRWNIKMKTTLGERYQLWLDLTDGVAEYLAHDVEILRYAFDGHLQKFDIDNHVALAVIENSLTLVRMAQNFCENQFKKYQKQTGVNLRPFFQGGSFADVVFHWEQGVKVFLATPDDKPEINFNDCKQVELAYDILSRKIYDGQTYNRSSREALVLNEDVCRKTCADYDAMIEELDQLNAAS